MVSDHRERIDIHAHIGRFEGYDLSEATLLSELEGADIALALVSNIDGAAVPGKTRDLPEIPANEATLDVVRRHPNRLRGLLWGRPGTGDPDHLRPFLSRKIHPGGGEGWTERVFVGLKLHPEMNHFQADAGSVDPYLVLASEAGLPVVFHSDARVDRASPERIVALAARHPTVPVVLYHTGFQGPHEPAIEAAVRALARHEADVYLETAQLPPAAALLAVERVGAERVLFGTDAPYYGTGHYDRYAELVRALEGTLRPPELVSVLSGNARRLFRLDPDLSISTGPSPPNPVAP